MKLILDQGNTSTKIALFNESELVEKFLFGRDDSDSAQKKINHLLPEVSRVILSNVTNHNFDFALVPVLKFTNSTPIPIHNKYETPKSLGADRLANAVGGYSLNPNGNSLIIDLGTCVKYDLVINGEYLGGNIAPGLAMRYKALHQLTDKLPLLETENFEFNFGTNTETSLRNGAHHGLFHEINGFIERYSDQFPGLTIFMTGGDAKFFDKEYKNPIFANSNLTLLGLNEILEYNAE